MELKIKVKPIHYKERFFGLYRTKDELEAIVRNNGYQAFGSLYSGFVSRDGKTVFGVNYEKFRRKTERRVVTNGKNKGKIESVVVREAHWEAYVYRFDLELLRLAGLKLIQGSRNFRLESIK